MWNIIVERIPSLAQWGYIFLSFILPFTVYKINQWFHQEMDPPWKKDEESNQQTNQQSKKQPSS